MIQKSESRAEHINIYLKENKNDNFTRIEVQSSFPRTWSEEKIS